MTDPINLHGITNMSAVCREFMGCLATCDEGQTTAEIAPHCPSAPDRTAVSRAACDLRRAGLIDEVGEKLSHEGRGARMVKAYAITDAGLAAMDQSPEQEPETMTETPAEYRLEIETPDEILAELADLSTNTLSRLRMVEPIPDAERHAERLRALSTALSTITAHSEGAVLTQLWLCSLAEALEEQAR